MKKSKTPFLLRAVRWGFPKLERVAPWLAYRYFVRIFFTPLNYKTPDKEVALQKKAEKFSFEVNGKRIQAYRWGKGPLVVVMHGWAGRASQFRKFIEVLVTQGYRVAGFDGPAHGNSEGVSTDIFEFEQAFRRLYEIEGEPEAIIAHSFGGSAVLFSAMNGLPVKKLINIASPTIGDEIIKTYLTAIGGSWKTGEAFKKYVLRKSGKPFDEFTAVHFIQQIKQPINLLLVHDADDEEVGLDQAQRLRELYPAALIFETKGLGHTRILKDENVIKACVTFIENGRLSS